MSGCFDISKLRLRGGFFRYITQNLKLRIFHQFLYIKLIYLLTVELIIALNFAKKAANLVLVHKKLTYEWNDPEVDRPGF